MKGKIEIVNADSTRYMHFYTGSGGLVDGTLAVLDSGTAIQASEGVATAILLGVVIGDYDAGEVCTIYPLTGTELKMDVYQGGATDTFAAANVGTPFDLEIVTSTTPDEFYINANDTTNGFLILMSYDNTAAKANLRALNSVIYVG
jgi:hypothetical protein